MQAASSIAGLPAPKRFRARNFALCGAQPEAPRLRTPARIWKSLRDTFDMGSV